MTGSQFPRASSGQAVVIDGDLWNRLMDQVERNGRLYACPPLLLADNAGGKVLSLARTAAPNVLVKIVSNSGSGGQYSGNVMSGVLTPDGTGAYALPAGLTAGQDVLIVNDDEYGNVTHWIEANSYAEGVYDGGTSTEGTPHPVVRVQRAKYRTASPVTIGSSSMRTTASTDAWNRTTSDAPLSRWVCTGVYWDSGTGALKAHMALDTIAADGRLHSMSAETDYTINTAVDPCA